MPLTAAAFARRLRRSTAKLVGQQALAPAQVDADSPPRPSRVQNSRVEARLLWSRVSDAFAEVDLVPVGVLAAGAGFVSVVALIGAVVVSFVALIVAVGVVGVVALIGVVTALAGLVAEVAGLVEARRQRR